MKKKIGVIGVTGRVGALVAKQILDSNYVLGPCFSRSQDPYIDLKTIFESNDYIIDFSSSSLISDILKHALVNPKALIICTTGWDQNDFKKELDALSKKIPIVITANTSIGTAMQRYLAKKISVILDAKYDIDILEKHHNKKIDSPSGTAKSIAEDIKSTKLNKFDLDYTISEYFDGVRPKNLINIISQRSGNLSGEHEISFTSEDEYISIKHIVFNRLVFAKGALKIVDWLENMNKEPGIYNMLDVLELKDD